MPSNSFSRFHSASRLPTQESKRAKRLRLKEQKESRAALSRLRSTNQPVYTQQPPEASNHNDSMQFNVDIEGASEWIDEELNLSNETQDSLRQIRLEKERLLQQNKQRRWVNLMVVLLPTYLHMKQVTNDWTTLTWDQDRSSDVCACPIENKTSRVVDLVDIMGQKRQNLSFCSCMPDQVFLMTQGYIGSTPAFPQTAFSVRLLNFYDLLWNLCNSHATPFAEVIRRWNEPRSSRLLAKKSTKPRELRRNLSGAIDAYRYLRRTSQQMIETVTSPHPQDRLAQRSCPSCFGRSHPELLTKKNDNEIFICLDGNFQHRHHERAEKGHLLLQTPVLFIPPDEVEDAKDEIRQHELALRKSDKAKDRCSEIHKAADDKRNETTWKGCDDTGLMGCCCRHDAVVYYCNISQSGEGRGLPFSIIKHLFTELHSSSQLRILYDIGCSLDKFIKLRKLLPHFSERMKFATSVFHSYVHDWKCQVAYNPRLNDGWGLTDGEGLERLWSYLSTLVSPLRYATRNHRLSSINHRSFFHNAQGIERLVATLRRKTINALAHQKAAFKVLDDLTVLPNPHSSPLANYTHAFFRGQWERQRSFESNQKQADIEKKQELAQFLERAEQLQSLAESFKSMVGTSMEDNNNALIILERIHQLQKTHDEQLVNSGGYFNNLNAHNKDREKKLVLLWSAKSALFKKAVDIQSELQPLKNSKSRGDRLGTRLKEKIFAALNRRKAGVSNAIKTFCNRRCEYLKKFAPELVNLPENQPFDYKTFLTMTLDDPIWNDGFLCTSQEPWAVDPTVRSGIHAVLALDRASEEIERITIDLQHALSWGVYHYQQLTQCRHKCSDKDHENDDIVCLAAKELGGHSAAGFRMGTTILQGEIERALNQHRLLLLSWHHSILALLSKKLTNRSDLPGCWFDLLEILVMNVHTGSTGDIDEDMEIVELDDGDSDGESVGVAVLDDYEDENDEERAATAPV